VQQNIVQYALQFHHLSYSVIFLARATNQGPEPRGFPQFPSGTQEFTL